MTEDPLRRLRQIDGALPDPEISPALAMAIFEGAADAMIIVNMETRNIRYVNSMAEFVFGYHRSELVGQPIELLVPEDMRGHHARDTEMYAALPRTRPMAHGRLLEGRHKTGKPIQANIMLTPVSVPEGQFVLATIRLYAGDLTAMRLGDDSPASRS